LSRPFSRGDAVPFAAGLAGPSLASSTTRSWSLFSPSLCCRINHQRFVKARARFAMRAKRTDPRHSRGLCPCRAPSSSSSSADARVADPAYCAACCTFLAPLVIWNSSATRRRGHTLGLACRETFTAGRFARLIRFAADLRDLFVDIFMDRTFTILPLGWIFAEKYRELGGTRRGLGWNGRSTRDGTEREFSLLPSSRLNKATVLSDGRKRHRRNYLSFGPPRDLRSLRGERRIIGRMDRGVPLFSSIALCSTAEKYRSLPEALEYAPRCGVSRFIAI